MSAVIDFHSHILPKVDDGSSSLEESIALLRLEAQQGISHVIATPHFYPQHDTPEHFLKRRLQAELLLQEEMEKHTGMPKLSIGAEVYYFNGISGADALSELTIDGKPYVLIEMPYAPWTEKMLHELEAIYVKRGLTPIVAHLDRYLTKFTARKTLERMAELPVLIQVNGEFFLQRSTKRMALRMLDRGHIHLLGSDCHNLKDRQPNLGPALELIRSKLGEEPLEHIAYFEQQVLTGEGIEG